MSLQHEGEKPLVPGQGLPEAQAGEVTEVTETHELKIEETVTRTATVVNAGSILPLLPPADRQLGSGDQPRSEPEVLIGPRLEERLVTAGELNEEHNSRKRAERLLRQQINGPRQSAEKAQEGAEDARDEVKRIAGEVRTDAETVEKTKENIERLIAEGATKGEKGDTGDKGDQGEQGPAGVVDPTEAKGFADRSEAGAQRSEDAATRAETAADDAQRSYQEQEKRNKEQQTRNRRQMKYIIGTWILGGVGLATVLIIALSSDREKTAINQTPVQSQSEDIGIPENIIVHIKTLEINAPQLNDNK